MQKLKNVKRYTKISDTPFNPRSLIHRDSWFPPCFVRQNQQKNNFFFARRFETFFKQKCSNQRKLLSIFSPQGFRISKDIGHPTTQVSIHVAASHKAPSTRHSSHKYRCQDPMQYLHDKVGRKRWGWHQMLFQHTFKVYQTICI